MARLLLRRLPQVALALLGVSFFAFVLLHLSGDPAQLLLPESAGPEEVARVRRAMGFDEPLLVQFGRFLRRAARGDFGRSLAFDQPALGLVLERLPATFELALAACLVAGVVTIPLGVLAALRRGTAVDLAAMAATLLGQAMPTFWWGLVLIMVFAVALGWLPPTGRGGLAHLVLPAVALGTYSTARTARLIRAGMLEELGREYVRTGRAIGLPERRVVLRQAFPNILIPVVTVAAMEFGVMLGGAMIIETVFAWPGLGRLMIQAIYRRDFPVVQAAVFVLCLLFVTMNLLLDLAYAWLDPRVRVR
jgi:ABC-type dipeptide/oligopeptide/nickel transport system permease component